jgi:crossover junction endodeoxyribonuclease RuvC
MKIYIGIDPGLSGAIAVIDEHGKVVSLNDTPTLAVKKGKGTKHVYVESAMATLLEGGLRHDSIVILENVHAFPGQGVTSMFSLGVGVGIWRGIIAALKLPVEFVEPAVWKRAMGIPTGSDKSVSIVHAAQLFPGADLKRKKDHGRADALLIAEYSRRKREGK